MTAPAAPPVFDHRPFRRMLAIVLVLGIVLAVAVVVVGTQQEVRRVTEARRATDQRQANDLSVIIHGRLEPGRPLTDEEFDRAVTLLDSLSRDARKRAGIAAGRSMDSQVRRDRLTDLARRKHTGDPDDRYTALILASHLNLPELHDWAVASRDDPDPGVRQVAEAILAREAPRLR